MKKTLLAFSLLLSAFSSADERLLVALENGGVVQLNAKTGKILTETPTGDSFGVIYSQDGQKAYATDKTEGALLVINAQNGAIETKIPLGKNPQQPALTSDGRLYVPMSGEGSVVEVDINSPIRVTNKIEIGTGSKPHIVALSPDKNTLWVTVQGIDPRVVSIDLKNGYSKKDYRYDLVPRVIAGFDQGAYFTAHHSTGLHRVELGTGALSTPIMDQFGDFSEARKQIEGISTSSDGKILAMTHEGRKALIAVRMKENKKCTIETLANKPYWVSLSKNSEVAYVSIPDAGLVEAYNIEDCHQKPRWSAKVEGKAKRMDLF